MSYEDRVRRAATHAFCTNPDCGCEAWPGMSEREEKALERLKRAAMWCGKCGAAKPTNEGMDRYRRAAKALARAAGVYARAVAAKERK